MSIKKLIVIPAVLLAIATAAFAQSAPDKTKVAPAKTGVMAKAPAAKKVMKMTAKKSMKKAMKKAAVAKPAVKKAAKAAAMKAPAAKPVAP
jgi:hypothetical protein